MKKSEFQKRWIGGGDGESTRFEMRVKKSMVGDEALTQEFDADQLMDGDLDDMPMADEGSDTMGRRYSDAVYEALGGLNRRPTSMSPVPDAGAGPTYQDGIPTYRPQAFTEGDGRVGQEPRRGPFAPNLDAGSGSYIDREGGQPGEGDYAPVTSIPGGMRILNPMASGIAPAASADFPDAATVVKRAPKRGLFKSVLDPRKNPLNGFGA